MAQFDSFAPRKSPDPLWTESARPCVGMAFDLCFLRGFCGGSGSGFFRGCILEITDERLLEAACLSFRHELSGRSLRQHLALMHHRHAIATFGLIHEMSGEKDGDAVFPGEPNEQFPESVSGDRVNARGGFVEK